MSHLRVGEEGCRYKDINEVFTKGTVAGQLMTNWKSLAEELEIGVLDVLGLENDMMLNKTHRNEIIPEILTHWVGATGHSATLDKLILALENIGWQKAADALREKFLIPPAPVKSVASPNEIFIPNASPEKPKKFALRYLGDTTPREFLLKFKCILMDAVTDNNSVLANSIVAQVQALLKLDQMLMSNVNNEKSQKIRCCNLLELVETQENMNEGSVQKTLDLMINLKGLPTFSAGIRDVIKNDYYEDVEII